MSIGITGTNGKTSTAGFLAAILKEMARPVAQVTTLGAFLDDEELAVERTHQGMLSVVDRCCREGGRFAVLEVTSQVLARGFARWWPFRGAVFTNLSHDHLDAHRGHENYFASKAQLFAALPAETGIAVLNGCDAVNCRLEALLSATVRKVRYGVPSRGAPLVPLDLAARDVEVSWQGTSASIEAGPLLDAQRFRLTIRGIGEIYLENAIAALAMGLACGASFDRALRALETAALPTGRFERVANAPSVVVDYAHTPDALERTLATARRLAKGAVWLVFGAGGDCDRDKRPHMGAAATLADRVIITSDNPRSENPLQIAAAIREGVSSRVNCDIELDRERAISRAVLDAHEEDVVVIAGKGHENVQIVGTERRPFSDSDVAKRAARRRPRKH